MKKNILLVTFITMALILPGCSSAKIDELNDRVIELENKNTEISQELEQARKEITGKDAQIKELEDTIEAKKSEYNVLIENIELVSDEVHQEGPATGKLYGGFDVSVKILNQSTKDLENVKVSVKMETSLNNYSKSLNVKTTKIATIKTLKASEGKEILFTDFKVDHPEMIQEIIVNVLDYGEVKKIKIPSAFAPGTQD